MKKIARYKRRGPSTKVLEWKRKNPWFGEDWEKTWDALRIHEQLLELGIKADSDEYYKELDARLNAPEIELTEHQLRLAKELGLDIALRKRGEK